VAEPKTKPTAAGVKDFLAAVADPTRKADCQAVLKLMKGITKAEPVMWGPSIVGFGAMTYTYPSGRTGEWFVLGFSPRKKDLTLYVGTGLSGFGDLLAKLGEHKCGKACLYVNKLADVDPKVLKELLTRAAKQAAG
jgi:hypothetical protein